MFRKIAEFYAKAREWARDYEPAVAATLAAAVFQLLLGLGIAVGDWPDKIDAVLGFVALLTTLLAGRKIRQRVYSPASYAKGVRSARRLR